MKKQLSWAGALGLAGAMLLSGCGGGGGTTTTTDSSAPPASTSAAPETTTAPAPPTTAPAGATIRVWLVGTDTPQAARDYLKTTFEAENPGNTLVIEEQSWTGLVEKYLTSLSGSDSPDVVEIGNTQAPTFTSTGFFADLTDKYAELGGDDMLPGFVEVGSFDGKFYAAPYYSGARTITYTSQIFTDPVPTTYDAFMAAAKAASTDTRSGIFMTGKDWRNGMTHVWQAGAEIATYADGVWKGGFNTPEGIAGLTVFQNIFTDGVSHAATDAVQDTNGVVAYCEGNVTFYPGASWISGVLADDANGGCSATFAAADDLHQFAVPGTAPGQFAPGLAGGSNLAIAAKAPNPDLAYQALRIMLSDDYQKILAELGLVPALISQARFMPDNEFTKASAGAASAAKLTPPSQNWALVERLQILEDGFAKIAQGEDVATVAADMDDKIEAVLNQ